MTWLKNILKEFFRKGDLVLLSLCILASLCGVVLIYSATRWLGTAGDRMVLIQLVAIALGIVVYIIMSHVDVELFTQKSWKWMLAFNVGFILLLLTPLGWGAETTGNNSWLRFPFLPVDIQPTEIAKVFFIMLLAWQCAKYKETDISSIPSVTLLSGHTLMMLGIILVSSGDYGMALVYLSLFVLMAWAAGVQKRWFALALVAGGGLGYVIWDHLPSYTTRRVTVIWDHIQGVTEATSYWEQTQGIGYQQTRSILAIGSGGLTGQGYLQGTQTQSLAQESLPARYNDEIFAVCGEEFGMIGCLVVMAILVAIILRCLWVGRKASSPMNGYVAIGYGSMLFIQAFINISACLYIFPLVGLTLPFFSYGGSSIITLFACMGIVSGIRTRSLPSWLKDRSQL